jgi:hypothetical protein
MIVFAHIVAWPVAFILIISGAPVWIWLGVAFAAFGNLIHQFAHMPKVHLPRWVRAMQEAGIFIGHEHHDDHHRYMGKLIDKESASRAYCPMTNILNPFLDLINFWAIAEATLATFGIHTVGGSHARNEIDSP